MNQLRNLLKSTFLREDSGATAVEYSVMLALIIITCIGTISTFGGTSGGIWSDSLSTIESEFSASQSGS